MSLELFGQAEASGSVSGQLRSPDDFNFPPESRLSRLMAMHTLHAMCRRVRRAGGTRHAARLQASQVVDSGHGIK